MKIFVFVDEVVMKIFVYLLITNPSFYENIVNIFNMILRQILFELIKQLFKNSLVFNERDVNLKPSLTGSRHEASPS